MTKRLASSFANLLLAAIFTPIALYGIYGAFYYYGYAMRGGLDRFSPWFLAWYSLLWAVWSSALMMCAVFLAFRAFRRYTELLALPPGSGADSGHFVEVDVPFSFADINRISFWSIFLVAMVTVPSYLIVWRLTALPTMNDFLFFGFFGIPILVVSGVVHELLHAAGCSSKIRRY